MFNFKHRKRRLLAALAILVSAQACINPEDFNPERIAGVKASPSVAVPLLYGELSIGDLLPEEGSDYVKVDQDQLVHIMFSDTLSSTSIRDYFLLPNLNYNNTFYPATEGTLTGNQQIVAEEEIVLDLTFPKTDLETLKLKTGQIVLSGSSNLDSEVEVQLYFPTATKDGESLTITLKLPANSSSQHTTELDLAGYTVDMSGYGMGENLIPVHVKGTLSGQNNSPFTLANYVQIDLEVNNLQYKLLEGYFGKMEVSLPKGDIALDGAFEQIFSKGNFGLKNPSLRFDILNSNGMPVQGIVNSMQARNNQGEALQIKTDPSSPFIIAYPTEIGQTAKTTIEVTNVGEILELAPSHIDYDFSGVLNPDGFSGNLNFLTDSSEVSAVLHADVPLWGYLKGLHLSETMPFPLEVMEVDVEEVSIRVAIENEFPLGADVQVYFTDNLYRPIDSLFDDTNKSLIRPSTVTADGELASSSNYTLDIPYTGERFARIMKSEHIMIKALLYTSRNEDGSQPHVKIKADHRLNIHLGARADNLNITVENN